MQGEPPRRDESLRALVEEVALDERVGDEALQVVRRLPLHAGGDFFAEQFEEKVGHSEILRETDAATRRHPAPLPDGRGGAIPSLLREKVARSAG